jgi:hypothetical protein
MEFKQALSGPCTAIERTTAHTMEITCEVMGCHHMARWQRPDTVQTNVEENLCAEHYRQLLSRSPQIACHFEPIQSAPSLRDSERAPSRCKDAA